MPAAHRDGDSRNCGATTTVQNQGSVNVNGKLWAVKDSTDSHGAGGLINTTGSTVFIEGKPVIVHGPDHANPDNLCLTNAVHSAPMTAGGTTKVNAHCF